MIPTGPEDRDNLIEQLETLIVGGCGVADAAATLTMTPGEIARFLEQMGHTDIMDTLRTNDNEQNEDRYSRAQLRVLGAARQVRHTGQLTDLYTLHEAVDELETAETLRASS